MMLLVFGTLLLGAAVFLLAEAATVPARRRREALNRVATYGSAEGSRSERRARSRGDQGLLDPLWRIVAALVLRVVPRLSREAVDKRLIAAGLAPRISPDQLLAAKGLLTSFGVVVGITVASKSLAAGIFLIFCFVFLGFMTPDMLVNSRIRARQDHIQAGLPDALDLLAVSVEAGLSFEGAVAKLVEYMEGPLVEEFALTLNEIRIGESRTDALKRMEMRIGVAELTTFVGAVVQAEQLGASMATILRAQAADARVHRQLTAEEKAMKLPVKMLVPMAVFILPATLIVVLGSALMSLGRSL
jgi:tight adherence protein C